MPEKNVKYRVFVRCSHTYSYLGNPKRTTYTMERDGLDSLKECIVCSGNFLNFNLMNDLSDKLYDLYHAADSKNYSFPYTVCVDNLMEDKDTKNYFEATLIVHKDVYEVMR